MLRLEFEGFFQLRMATDPDPTDEWRGVSGYTFPLAGEPDLDRTVHFQKEEKEFAFGPTAKGKARRSASRSGGPRATGCRTPTW
jgi:hypothetical protein